MENELSCGALVDDNWIEEATLTEWEAVLLSEEVVQLCLKTTHKICVENVTVQTAMDESNFCHFLMQIIMQAYRAQKSFNVLFEACWVLTILSDKRSLPRLSQKLGIYIFINKIYRQNYLRK